MANNGNKKVVDLASWGMRALMISSRITAFFATRISRSLIVVIFIFIAGYLAYQRAWKPILATAPLPPGVTVKSPQLNTELLQTINSKRVERAEAARQQFNVEALLRPPPPVQ